MSRDLLLIALSLFTWGVGEGAFYFFQPLYLEQLGASPVAIGSILGAMGIAMTIMHVPAGYLADRVGRRGLMWAAWIVGLIAAWGMALARSLPWFTASLLLYGLTSFVVAPMNSYITAARGRWTVGRAITMISATYNSGAIIGPLLGGLIGNRYGLQSIYLFAALIFLISILFIFFIRAQPVEPRQTSQNRDILRNAQFRNYLPLLFFAVFSMYLSQPLSSNFLQNERGLTLKTIGVLGSISSLGNVFLAFGLGSLKTAAGFLLGQGTVVLFAALLWQGQGLPWYVMAYFLLGGYRAARALAIARVGIMIAQIQMGLAYGIAEAVCNFAVILAPPLAGLLYQHSPAAPYQVTILLVSLSIIAGVYFLKPTQSSPISQTEGG